MNLNPGLAMQNQEIVFSSPTCFNNKAAIQWSCKKYLGVIMDSKSAFWENCGLVKRLAKEIWFLHKLWST